MGKSKPFSWAASICCGWCVCFSCNIQNPLQAWHSPTTCWSTAIDASPSLQHWKHNSCCTRSSITRSQCTGVRWHQYFMYTYAGQYHWSFGTCHDCHHPSMEGPSVFWWHTIPSCLFMQSFTVIPRTTRCSGDQFSASDFSAWHNQTRSSILISDRWWCWQYW